MGNWEAERVGYFTPYLEGDKFTILQDGEVLCKELYLDFDEVYKRTNTSYKPIFIEESWETDIEIFGVKQKLPYGGRWYSDYKSASSVERVEAFIKLGRPDPAPYADETGPVTWEHVVTEVTKVLDNHNN
jgi:7-cyano-7-deazaguanine synthase